MANQDPITVMVSSRCKVKIPYDGSTKPLSEVRKQLKSAIESENLFGERPFKVWICEDSASLDGSLTAWEHCIKRARDCDIFIALFDGHSGDAGEDGSIGICHAELQAAWDRAPNKVFLIRLPDHSRTSGSEVLLDEKFRQYATQIEFFRHSADTGEEVIRETKRALAEAVIQMAHDGSHGAKKGRFHIGNALDWSRLNYRERKLRLEDTVRSALSKRSSSTTFE